MPRGWGLANTKRQVPVQNNCDSTSPNDETKKLQLPQVMSTIWGKGKNKARHSNRASKPTATFAPAGIMRWRKRANVALAQNQLSLSQLSAESFETSGKNQRDQINSWHSGVNMVARMTLKNNSYNVKKVCPIQDAHLLMETAGKGKRLAKFGSRLHGQKPEFLKSIPGHIIKYIGKGRSTHLHPNLVPHAKHNLSASSLVLPPALKKENTSSSIEGHSSVLHNMRDRSTLLDQFSYENGWRRYGHTGPWYNRTPRNDLGLHAALDGILKTQGGIQPLFNIDDLSRDMVVMPVEQLEPVVERPKQPKVVIINRKSVAKAEIRSVSTVKGKPDSMHIDTKAEKESSRLTKNIFDELAKTQYSLPAKPLVMLCDCQKLIEDKHVLNMKKKLWMDAVRNDLSLRKYFSEKVKEMAEINQMMEEDWTASHAHLNSGKCETKISNAWKTVKIFVSSTFRDMHGERDLINDLVVPQINEILKRYRVHVIVVDLRWGLTVEDTSNAGLGALDHCLREVENCKPYFIQLLGDLYGWCPDDYRVSKQKDFEWMQSYPPGFSATHLECIQGLLRFSGKPVRGFCYQRDPSFLEDIQDPETRSIFEFDYPGDNVKLELRESMRRQLKAHPFVSYHNYKCLYGGRDPHGRPCVKHLASLAEKMITDVTYAVLTENNLIDIEKPLSLYNHQKIISASLKENRKKWVSNWPTGRENQHDTASVLRNVSVNAHTQHNVAQEQELMCREEILHTQHMLQNLHNYVDRPDIEVLIWKKIHECDPQQKADNGSMNHSIRTVAILGESGSGKTSILSFISHKLESSSMERAHLFYYACDASELSGNLKMMMYRIGTTLAKRFGVDRRCDEYFHHFKSMSTRNCRIWLEKILNEIALEASSRNHYVIIVIDGADQMDEEDGALSLSWLPERTSIGCRIFISVTVDRKRIKKANNLTESCSHTIQDALANFSPPLPVIPVGMLNPIQSHQAILSFLGRHSQSLTLPQIQLLLRKCDGGHPLYLYVCATELNFADSFGKAYYINQKLSTFPERLRMLFDQVLSRVEYELDVFCESHYTEGEMELLKSGHHWQTQKAQREYLNGRDIVMHALSLIVCSRKGLYESDLLQMIHVPEMSFGNALPKIVWSRIYHAIKPYLYRRLCSSHDHCIIRFSHNSFCRAIRERYMPPSSPEGRAMLRSHNKQLADFMLGFSGVKDYAHWSPVFGKEDINACRDIFTALKDIAFYQIQALDIKALRDTTLGNLAYLEMAARMSSLDQNIGASLFSSIMQNYKFALNIMKTAALSELQQPLIDANTTRREVIWWLQGMLEFVRKHQHSLVRAPLLCLQYAFNQIDNSAPHIWAKEIILLENLDVHDDSINAYHASNQRLTHCQLLNKRKLKFLECSYGPFAAGTVCSASLKNNLEALGLANGDVVIIKRVSGEILHAVRSSQYETTSRGHCALITSIQSTGDQSHFISTSLDHRVIVWDAQTCTPLKYGGQTHNNFFGQPSPEENLAKTNIEDNIVQPHTIDEYIFLQEDGHNGSVTCCKILSEISTCNSVVRNGQQMQEIVYKICFVTGSLDKTVILWSFERTSTESEDQLKTDGCADQAINQMFHGVFGKLLLVERTDVNLGVHALEVQDNSSTLAVGTESGYVQILDYSHVDGLDDKGSDEGAYMAKSKSWKAHDTAVTCLAYVNVASKGEYWLATGSSDATVKIWKQNDNGVATQSEAQPATPLCVLQCSAGAIRQLKWAPLFQQDENTNIWPLGGEYCIAAGGVHNEIIMWAIDPKNYWARKLHSLEGHIDTVNDFHFLWSTNDKTGPSLSANKEDDEKLAGLTVHLKSLKLVSTSGDKHFHVWDLMNLFHTKECAIEPSVNETKIGDAEHGTEKYHAFAVTACAVSKLGDYAATGDENGTIYTWKIASGEIVSDLHVKSITTNGKRGSKSDIEVKDGDREMNANNSPAISALSVSDMGTTIAAGTSKGQVYVWMRSKRNELTLPLTVTRSPSVMYYIILSAVNFGHEKSIQDIEILDDNSRKQSVSLATGDCSGYLKVWSSGQYFENGLKDGKEPKIPIRELDLTREHILKSPIIRLLKERPKFPLASAQSPDISLQCSDQSKNASESVLLVFKEDASISVIDLTSWTVLMTLAPKSKIMHTRSTFSMSRHEFTLISTSNMKGMIGKPSCSKNTNPAPRLRSWRVPVLKEDQGNNCCAYFFDEKPLMSTFTSQKVNGDIGDITYALCNTVQCTSNGRFIVGIYDDNTLRGYDMDKDGKRCFSFVFPSKIICMDISSHANEPVLICGDTHGQVYILSLGIKHGLGLVDNMIKFQPPRSNAQSNGESDKEFVRQHRIYSALESAKRLELFSEIYSDTPKSIPKIKLLKSHYVVNNMKGDEQLHESEDKLVASIISEAGQMKSEVVFSSKEIIQSMGVDFIDKPSIDAAESASAWSALHIMGFVDIEGAPQPLKTAIPQILSVFKECIAPAAIEFQSAIFCCGNSKNIRKFTRSAERDNTRTQQLLDVKPVTILDVYPLKEGLKHNFSSLMSGMGTADKFVFIKDACGKGEDLRFVSQTMVLLHEQLHLPSCALLIRGGVEEKEVLLQYVVSGIPIIVVKGLGGYADHIAKLRANLNKPVCPDRQNWDIIRSKMYGKRVRFGNLVSSITLRSDPITKLIVKYPKLHVISVGAAKGDITALLKRLLQNRKRIALK